MPFPKSSAINEMSFPDALRTLRTERGWSFRNLSEKTKEETGWGSHSMLNLMEQDKIPPSREGMEAIAKVFRIKPETFAAYRMMLLRDQLDPQVVGHKKALALLKRCEDAGLA